MNKSEINNTRFFRNFIYLFLSHKLKLFINIARSLICLYYKYNIALHGHGRLWIALRSTTNFHMNMDKPEDLPGSNF